MKNAVQPWRRSDVRRALRSGVSRDPPVRVAPRLRQAITRTTVSPALCNKRYCYPLTVTDHASRYLLLCEVLESTRDHASRYLLLCEVLESTREALAFTAFARLFRESGLPLGIRSDNGVPFASPHSLFNLSRLSV